MPNFTHNRARIVEPQEGKRVRNGICDRFPEGGARHVLRFIPTTGGACRGSVREIHRDAMQPRPETPGVPDVLVASETSATDVLPLRRGRGHGSAATAQRGPPRLLPPTRRQILRCQAFGNRGAAGDRAAASRICLPADPDLDFRWRPMTRRRPSLRSFSDGILSLAFDTTSGAADRSRPSVAVVFRWRRPRRATRRALPVSSRA